MNSSYRKLVKNFFSVSIGQFASKLLSYFLLPLYTYVLSTEEYGTFDLLSTTVSLIFPIITLDIAEGCFRFSMDKECDKRQIFSTGFYFTVFASCLGFLLYPILSVISEIKHNYILFVLLLISTMFNTFVLQFTKGCQKVQLYAVGGVINTAVLISLNLLFLLVFKLGLIGYLLAYIISYFSVSFILLISLKFWRFFLPVKKLDKGTIKSLLNYTMPMIPNTISWWISNSSDKYMLKFAVGTATLGIYSVAYKIPSAMTIVSTIFMSAWSISAVEDFGSQKSKEMFSNIYKAFFGVCVIVAALLIFFSKNIASILYQKDFFMAWKCSTILIVAYVFNSLATFLGSIYTSAKKTKMLMITTLIAAIFNIILNILMIPFWGMYGAALATLISYAIMWIFRLANTRKILKFEISFITNALSILFLILMVLNVFINSDYSIIFSLLLLILICICNIFNVVKFINKKKQL